MVVCSTEGGREGGRGQEGGGEEREGGRGKKREGGRGEEREGGSRRGGRERWKERKREKQ